MTDFLTDIAPEIFYALCGLVCLDAGWRAFATSAFGAASAF